MAHNLNYNGQTEKHSFFFSKGKSLAQLRADHYGLPNKRRSD